MAVDPIPNPPHTPQPPPADSQAQDMWRRGVEVGLAHVNRWPRVPYGIFDRAPDADDDETFGHEVGFLWLGVVDDGGIGVG